MAIDSGRLRHRIEVQEQGYLGQDPITGAEVREWRRFHACWAAIEPLSARELIAAQSTQSKVTARIVIRQVDGITSAMRIVHVVRGVTTVYNIEGVLADKDSGVEYLTLPVSQGVSIDGR